MTVNTLLDLLSQRSARMRDAKTFSVWGDRGVSMQAWYPQGSNGVSHMNLWFAPENKGMELSKESGSYKVFAVIGRPSDRNTV